VRDLILQVCGGLFVCLFVSLLYAVLCNEVCARRGSLCHVTDVTGCSERVVEEMRV